MGFIIKLWMTDFSLRLVFLCWLWLVEINSNYIITIVYSLSPVYVSHGNAAGWVSCGTSVWTGWIQKVE